MHPYNNELGVRFEMVSDSDIIESRQKIHVRMVCCWVWILGNEAVLEVNNKSA